MEDGDLIRIGEILKPHGVRGEVAACLRLDSPGCLDHLESLFLQHGNKAPREYDLHGLREHSGRVLLIFQGVEDRDAAEALRGCAVLIPTALLPPLQEEEIYLNQLQGCEVVLEDGSPLGRIREVLAPAGNEVWAIDTPDGREVLFPAEDQFILSADPDQGVVRIAPPPGLLEMYLEE